MKMQIVDFMLYPEGEYLACCDICKKHEGDEGAEEIFRIELKDQFEFTVCTGCRKNLVSILLAEPPAEKVIVKS